MIKFRVWDRIAQRMIYPGETVVDEMGDSFFIMIDQKGFIYEVYDSPLGYYLEENSERYELMLCVNEKDKNGKDIYVGDIIEFNDQGKSIRGIVKEDIYEIFVPQFYDKLRNFDWDTFEVIGNIYQNPEQIPPDFYEEKN